MASPNRLLLVEGSDDEHVMLALFKAHSLPQTFDITKPHARQGGVDELLKSLPVRLKQSGLERLGVVVDADEDAQRRWQAIKSILTTAGCAGLPAAPISTGTLAQIPDGPKVGVWIMPDNSASGMLESFLKFLAPQDDPLLHHVDTFINSIPGGAARCPAVRIPKARIHAWLAVQEEPGKPLGQAITAKYLDANVPEVGIFLNWVRAVLVD